MNSFRNTKKYNRDEYSLFGLLIKSKRVKRKNMMIFIVRRPQYFISHTTSQRSLECDTDSLASMVIVT